MPLFTNSSESDAPWVAALAAAAMDRRGYSCSTGSVLQRSLSARCRDVRFPSLWSRIVMGILRSARAHSVVQTGFRLGRLVAAVWIGAAADGRRARLIVLGSRALPAVAIGCVRQVVLPFRRLSGISMLCYFSAMPPSIRAGRLGSHAVCRAAPNIALDVARRAPGAVEQIHEPRRRTSFERAVQASAIIRSVEIAADAPEFALMLRARGADSGTTSKPNRSLWLQALQRGAHTA